MHGVLIAAARVLPTMLLVYLATRAARRERLRSERTGRSLRHWYLGLCALVIVLAFTGGIFSTLGS